jgi:hypothetical protein
MERLALATYAKLPNLNDDDRLLIDSFAALGVRAEPAVWDATDVAWEEFAAVIVRSCWDYHTRLAEFLCWIASLERLRVPLWNPAELLRWNSHKAYLRDLAAAGVETVPTHWLRRGEEASLAALLGAERWHEAVVKPAVSASAHGTWRTSVATAVQDQARLDALLARGDAMVQPYVDEVREQGEWSLVFLGSRFSHAALKRAGADDFRVQWEYGGSAVAGVPPLHLVRDAQRALSAVRGETLYARVDGVDRGGRLMLVEVELIEPHLFLGWDPQASSRLAGALVPRLR